MEEKIFLYFKTNYAVEVQKTNESTSSKTITSGVSES